MLPTLTPFLSLIIAGLLFVFFVQPTYDEISAIKQESKAYDEAIQSYDAFSQKLDDKVLVKNSETALQKERLDRLVPERIEITRILVDLENLAKNNSMLFGNISTEEEEGETGNSEEESAASQESGQGKLVSKDISFEVIGTYEQFKNFLRNLEESLTLFEITGISFDVTEDVFQQFAVTVRMYAYVKE
jgi:Tfp pilus assembly protein PilO